MPAIVKNGVIEGISLLHLRPTWTWITVWPFIPLYVVLLAAAADPEMFWDPIVYLVYRSYIDFFHGTSVPLLVFIHGALFMSTAWSPRFRAWVCYQTVSAPKDASHVLVKTHPHRGEAEIVPLVEEQKRQQDGVASSTEFHFKFQHRKWTYNVPQQCFCKPQYPTKHPFSHYTSWKGLTSAAEIAFAKYQYGENKMISDVPEFTKLLKEQAKSPLFLFQMGTMLLWCLDEYWMYAVFSGFMIVMLECVVVTQRIRNAKMLRSMSEIPTTKIWVFRGDKPTQVDSTALLPMDLIVVPTNAPCPVDAVLVSGTCVVNEATLTGESTPQLKEPIDALEDALSMKKHSRHLLFSGTEILVASGPNVLPATGNLRGQALAVVLKTGFETKQGKLLRLIFHNEGKVADNKEGYFFIAALVIFALAACGYVLRKGLNDPNKSRWKLFLSAVQIFTSVIPTELPMQLSIAVNTSMMQLVKLSVFCTEPFRIPFAGKIDTCCFDKTGTLTTDEMLLAGVDACDGEGIRGAKKSIPPMAEMVLASCHSLVRLEGQDIAGDAMEKASLLGLHYKLTGDDTVVYEAPKKDAAPSSNNKSGNTAAAAKPKEWNRSLRVLARFPFIAQLRRMAAAITSDDAHYIVCKGSPEAIRDLCETVPTQYDAISTAHARSGFRVLALAYRPMVPEERSHAGLRDLKRDTAESKLRFAGFAVYQCPLKKDALATISNLRGGRNRCVIITGDSVQTAISVGRDVALITCPKQLLNVKVDQGGSVTWADAETLQVESAASSSASTAIAKAMRWNEKTALWDLCIDAEQLNSTQFADVVRQYGDHVAIWARCNPSQKEDIVTHMKEKGRVVLMAGDGTNDVGALKQAHVGIAVLNSAGVQQQAHNPQKPAGSPTSGGGAVATSAAAANAADIPAGLVIPPNFPLTPIPAPIPQEAGFMVRVKYEAQLAKRRAEIQMLQRNQAKYKENVAAQQASYKAQTEGVVAPAKAAGSDAVPQQDPTEFLMQSLFNEEDGGGMGGPPMIKLGDASIAAPFTSKSKALMSICDIVRLGRCTLVTTIQMYKILAINALLTAYSLSILSSDGIKFGEKQMMASGLLTTICFLCLGRSLPTERLATSRPITRVFHPSVVVSILGQFLLHLHSFFDCVNLVANVSVEDLERQRGEGEGGEFKPSLLNTIMFLMTTLTTVTTFAVNYRGEPFMQGITKNRPMFFSVLGLIAMVFYFASESDAELNEYFEIVKFPTEDFRNQFLQMLMIDLVGAFSIEQLCRLVFRG